MAYRTYPRRDYARTSNRGTIAMVAVALVLLVLIFIFKGCGGSTPTASNSSSKVVSSVPVSSLAPSSAPSSAAPSSVVSTVSGGSDHVSIVSVTSPVASGAQCTVTILGKANHKYGIYVQWYEGIQTGLNGTKTTDANGNASWTFTVSGKKAGSYTVIVSDYITGEKATAKITLQ